MRLTGASVQEGESQALSKLVEDMRRSQSAWAAYPTFRRLRILREARHAMAREALQLASSVPLDLPGLLNRTLADTLIAEVLPLLDACRFLERESASILAPRRLGMKRSPIWLGGVSTVVERVPVGVVLILAPGNYPLFLPGVQALQALAAGNAVLWKPAHRGADAAEALRKILIASGLDPGLFNVLDDSVEAGIEATALPVNKVFLTGSASTGQSVMHALAETLTPSVMELSGCDAVFILDGIGDADMERAVDAIAFGLRFNGSATCMAPRRLFATATVTERILPRLVEKLTMLPPITTPSSTARKFDDLVEDAVGCGAKVLLDGRRANRSGPMKSLSPTLLDHANPSMLAVQSDIFAPLLSIVRIADDEHALAMYQHCPYALTASVFGPSDVATKFARCVHAGNVLINDVIVSTADPRAPFGGRRRSGFGSTRGREGLLEMTAVKTTQIQSSRSRRPYHITTPAHAEFFLGLVGAFHGKGLGERWRGIRQIFRAIRKIK